MKIAPRVDLRQHYAARLVKEGITVNAVAPSLIETDMMRARRDEMVPRIPLGRMGYPEEVAQAVLMVIGNPYMTGQTVQLNGAPSRFLSRRPTNELIAPETYDHQPGSPYPCRSCDRRVAIPEPWKKRWRNAAIRPCECPADRDSRNAQMKLVPVRGRNPIKPITYLLGQEPQPGEGCGSREPRHPIASVSATS